MNSRCLDLDHPLAADPAVAGAKAAGLAAARRAGLPVLPGVVVPAAESDAVVEAATMALPLSNSRARLAAMRVEPPAELIAEARELLSTMPSPWIVRSSSPLEGDGTWSGAFSSFHGVGPDDLATALRGCWGSAFAVDVLSRAEATETPPSELGVAVLIQPELTPDLGGTARLLHDGRVRITATDGPLSPLMAGHVEGVMAIVGPDGAIAPTPIDDHGLLRDVAALVREVEASLDHQLIEWAAVDGKVTLLQSLRSPDVATAPVTIPTDPAHTTAVAWRVALLTQQFPGPLADEFVLPWAVAGTEPPVLVPDPDATDPVAALATARAALHELLPRIWGGSPRAAAKEAQQVFRQLRGDDPRAAIDRIAALPSPGIDALTTVARNLATVRAAVRALGLVDSDEAFWRLSMEQLQRMVGGGVALQPPRLGVDRWEPFLYAVVRASGEHHYGTAAAPGAGAGLAHIITTPNPTIAPTGRRVLIAPEPGPALGPLLWNASGLVTRAGSTAAHLIEFANSIGVPTVVGCRLPQFDPAAPPLVAVDGEAGRVTVLDTQSARDRAWSGQPR